MVKYVATTTGTGVNQYPIMLHNGSTANSLSVRVFTDDTQRIGNIKGSTDAANLAAMRSRYKVQASELRTIIYSWDVAAQRQALLTDGVYAEDLSKVDFTGQSLTTLQLGGRTGGAEPLLGYIVSAEVGNVALTKAQMTAKAYEHAFVIALAGQSNAANMDSASFNYTGHYGIMATMPAQVSNSRETLVVNGATGSTSIFAVNDVGAGYWRNENTGERGPAAINFYAKLSELGVTPNMIFWSQGEGDASGVKTKAEYKTHLLAVFQDFRATFPKVRIVIGKLARRGQAYNYAPQYQMEAEAQQELIETYSWIVGQEIYDVGMFDFLHEDAAGYAVSGQRLARNAARLLGANPAGGTKGPKLLSAVRSGAVITATLQHDAGTDFVPATGIDGFYCHNGDVAATIASLTTSAGAATVKLNHVAHGLAIGDKVTFPTPVIFQGITLVGSYEVADVLSTDQFSILTRGGFSASTTATGGGPISAVYNKRIAVSSAVRASGTTVTVTLASQPNVLPATLYYGYDAMIGINIANILKDNGVNVLPMRRGKLSII